MMADLFSPVIFMCVPFATILCWGAEAEHKKTLLSFDNQVQDYSLSLDNRLAIVREYTALSLWNLQTKRSIWTQTYGKVVSPSIFGFSRDSSRFSIVDEITADCFFAEMRIAGTGKSIWKKTYSGLPPTALCIPHNDLVVLGSTDGVISFLVGQNGTLITSGKIFDSGIVGIECLDNVGKIFLVWSRDTGSKIIQLTASSTIEIEASIFRGKKLTNVAIDVGKKKIAVSDSYQISVYSYDFKDDLVKFVFEHDLSKCKEPIQHLQFVSSASKLIFFTHGKIGSLSMSDFKQVLLLQDNAYPFASPRLFLESDSSFCYISRKDIVIEKFENRGERKK